MPVFPQDTTNMENQGPTCEWLGSRRRQTGLAQLENKLSLCPIAATKNTIYVAQNHFGFCLLFLCAQGLLSESEAGGGVIYSQVGITLRYGSVVINKTPWDARM